jgi:signal transduction histidine kinase
MTNASSWNSIQWKLPALMGALLVLVVASLTFLAYESLERTLLVGAQERLTGAANLLGGALQPGFVRGDSTMAALAAQPAVSSFIADPEAGRTAAEAALKEAAGRGTTGSLEIRSADGACLLVYQRATGAVRDEGCFDWGSLAVESASVLPMRAMHDTASLGVAAPVRAPESEGGAAVGYVVTSQPLSPSGASGVDLIRGLIGTDARVFLANADGSLWTDLAKPIPAPHAQPLSEALLSYESEGEERLAKATALAFSPLMLVIEFPRDAVLAPLDRFLGGTLLAALVILVLGCATAWVVSHQIVLPLRQATRGAEAVAAGNYAERVMVRSQDEIGRLAAAFNVMADEVERSQRELEARVERRTQQLKDTMRQLRTTQDELVRKEKLATLGQLSSSVGHELRNPLGVMSNAVYFLKMVMKDPPAKVAEYLDILKNQITLSEKIISDLLDFARVKPPVTQTVAVADLVKDQLDRVGNPEGVEIVTAMGEGLAPVVVDRVQVGQVLFNLFTNAVQAMEGGGTLKVSAVPGTNGSVRLDVADTGSGITPEHMEIIFDPLFTTKARGIGLGLSVARSLARANRGDIEVTSEVGRGSTFTVTLPTMQQGAPS